MPSCRIAQEPMSGARPLVRRRAQCACLSMRGPTRPSFTACCTSSTRRAGRGSRWRCRRMRRTGRRSATACNAPQEDRIPTMQQPAKSGRQLIEEIDQTLSVTPALWWLGHAGFVVRFANITFYIDPCLSDPPGRTRRVAAPLAATDIRNADMVFATHGHPGHLDASSIVPILETCRGAKLVLPKSSSDAANAAGIPYNRTTTTDSGLRIEYFKDNLYGRVYAVPSAHPHLDWTAA